MKIIYQDIATHFIVYRAMTFPQTNLFKWTGNPQCQNLGIPLSEYQLSGVTSVKLCPVGQFELMCGYWLLRMNFRR